MARYYFPDVRMRLDDGRYFIPTTVAGISYRQEAASRCFQGQKLELARDPNNKYDKNAISIFADGEHIGFVPSDLNDGFAEYLDSGRTLDADIYKIVGGTEAKPSRGIYINLYLPQDVLIEFDGLDQTTAGPPPRVPHVARNQRDLKVNIDGAYKVDFEPRINYRDRQSRYAASYARFTDGSLIYIAERSKVGWFFGLWNPPRTRMYGTLRDCRTEIRQDFSDRFTEDSIQRKLQKGSLYFANMEWGTNYVYRRQMQFRDDMYDRYGSGVEVELLDYAVYFVFSNVHKYKKILYVVERIGKNWLWDRWDGGDIPAGKNLKDCQLAIWRHMDAWCKSGEYSERVARYKQLNRG